MREIYVAPQIAGRFPLDRQKERKRAEEREKKGERGRERERERERLPRRSRAGSRWRWTAARRGRGVRWCVSIPMSPLEVYVYT
jgi:hypothetical protein